MAFGLAPTKKRFDSVLEDFTAYMFVVGLIDRWPNNLYGLKQNIIDT